MTEYNNVKKNDVKKKNAADLPKVEKVTTGAAHMKKKSLGKRFVEALLPGNVTNVREYVINDCLIPTVKNAVVDMIQNGVEMFVFPEGRKRPKGIPGGKVNYGGMYRGNQVTKRTPSYGNEYRGFDYDQIEFESRADAEAVLEAIYELIEQYGFATVGRFYDAAGVTTTNVMTEKYCWTAMTGANIVRSGSAWYIDMPKPSPLD